MKNLLLFILLTAISYSTAQAQLHLLNDEFGHPCTLSEWQRLNDTEGWDADQLEILDINTESPGRLTMKPYTCVWYNDYRGPLVYKLVEGNFVFTTQVEVAAADGAGLPSSQFSLGGCMIRAPKAITSGGGDWTAGQENYVFLSIGYAKPDHHTCPLNEEGVGDCGPGPHFEVKETTRSVSTLSISPVSSQTVTIRLARIGNVIIVLRQVPGGPFEVHQRYNRIDFPEEVQVGFVTYTNWEKAGSYTTDFHNRHVLNEDLAADPTPGRPFNPDLLAQFEYARFNEVEVPPALAGLNLMDEAAVSDAALLSFLGFESEPATAAAAGRSYLAIYEAGDDEQQFWESMSWAQLAIRQAALAAEGLQLVDIDAYQEDGQWRYQGLWREGTEEQALYQYNSWSLFVKRWKKMNNLGFRLIDIETYWSGGHQYYSGVWQAGSGKYALYQYNTWRKFTKRWKNLANRGYRMIDVETFTRNDKRRYVGVWRGGTDKYAFYQYNSPESFLEKEEELREGDFRLIDVEAIHYNGNEWRLGVWKGAGTNRLKRYDSRECFLGDVAAMREEGFRLIDVELVE
ncbi:MAG: hypothetical protein H6559_00150 [Lewinellaceae bacterium]|nr:hypothetical protein [Lewinellaceae bacterium]